MWLEFSFMEGTERNGASPVSAAVENDWSYDYALTISLVNVDGAHLFTDRGYAIAIKTKIIFTKHFVWKTKIINFEKSIH